MNPEFSPEIEAASASVRAWFRTDISLYLQRAEERLAGELTSKKRPTDVTALRQIQQPKILANPRPAVEPGKVRVKAAPKDRKPHPNRREFAVGETINHLSYVSDLPRRQGTRQARWQCVCGAIRDAQVGHVVHGSITSCGCKRQLPWSNKPDRTERQAEIVRLRKTGMFPLEISKLVGGSRESVRFLLVREAEKDAELAAILAASTYAKCGTARAQSALAKRAVQSP
jgi:DNA-binding CsgD family transcriptional regulator